MIYFSLGCWIVSSWWPLTGRFCYQVLQLYLAIVCVLWDWGWGTDYASLFNETTGCDLQQGRVLAWHCDGFWFGRDTGCITWLGCTAVWYLYLGIAYQGHCLILEMVWTWGLGFDDLCDWWLAFYLGKTYAKLQGWCILADHGQYSIADSSSVYRKWRRKWTPVKCSTMLKKFDVCFSSFFTVETVSPGQCLCSPGLPWGQGWYTQNKTIPVILLKWLFLIL